MGLVKSAASTLTRVTQAHALPCGCSRPLLLSTRAKARPGSGDRAAQLTYRAVENLCTFDQSIRRMGCKRHHMPGPRHAEWQAQRGIRRVLPLQCARSCMGRDPGVGRPRYTQPDSAIPLTGKPFESKILLPSWGALRALKRVARVLSARIPDRRQRASHYCVCSLRRL